MKTIIKQPLDKIAASKMKPGEALLVEAEEDGTPKGRIYLCVETSRSTAVVDIEDGDVLLPESLSRVHGYPVRLELHANRLKKYDEMPPGTVFMVTIMDPDDAEPETDVYYLKTQIGAVDITILGDDEDVAFCVPPKLVVDGQPEEGEVLRDAMVSVVKLTE